MSPYPGVDTVAIGSSCVVMLCQRGRFQVQNGEDLGLGCIPSLRPLPTPIPGLQSSRDPLSWPDPTGGVRL